VVVLAVSAAPASAKMHLEDINLGTITDSNLPSVTPKESWWTRPR
jgi:hypothetical protein